MFITGVVMDSNPASVPEPVATVSSRIVIAWECGLCRMTNKDMMRRLCHICGQQRPVRYLIVGGPIEPQLVVGDGMVGALNQSMQRRKMLLMMTSLQKTMVMTMAKVTTKISPKI